MWKYVWLYTTTLYKGKAELLEWNSRLVVGGYTAGGAEGRPTSYIFLSKPNPI